MQWPAEQRAKVGCTIAMRIANVSPWIDVTRPSNYPPLLGTIKTDVGIIGGGITGLLTAWHLSYAGYSVAIIEDQLVGENTTGYSTGNLYTATGHNYRRLLGGWGRQKVQTFAAARQWAVDFLDNFIGDEAIDCEYQRQPFHYYTERRSHFSKIEREFEAMERAGLKPIWKADPLHFSTSSALKLNEGGRMNPALFCKALAQRLADRGVKIYERTRMLTNEQNQEKKTIATAFGSVVCRYVVEATHIPKGFSLLQTALYPYRSYALAIRLKDEKCYPKGIFWDTDPEYHHSTATHWSQDGPMLLVIGAGHKTGQPEEDQGYDAVERYVRKRYPVEAVTYRWSAQHYRSSDGFPMIGIPAGGHSYIATGFHADGLVWGTAAARHLANLILGQADENWTSAFDPNRINPLASAASVLKENANIAKYYAKDYLLGTDFVELSDIADGEGDIIHHNGQKVAAYKPGNGLPTVLLDAKCPHLHGIVRWNSAEKTWDCPIHGSRFDCNGGFLEGCAIHDLAKATTKE